MGAMKGKTGAGFLGRLKSGEVLSHGDLPQDGNVYYIYTPIAQLFSLFMRISVYMFFLYFISVHPVLTAIIVPLYMLVLYMYWLFWGVARRYDFSFLPVACVALAVNIPMFFIAGALRGFLLELIF